MGVEDAEDFGAVPLLEVYVPRGVGIDFVNGLVVRGQLGLAPDGEELEQGLGCVVDGVREWEVGEAAVGCDFEGAWGSGVSSHCASYGRACNG
jgi:hypothetical protein